jgi:hypothetical protein
MSQDQTPSPDPQPSEPFPSVAPASTPDPSPATTKVTPKVSTDASTLQKVKQSWQTVQSVVITIGSTAVQWGKQVRAAWNVIQPKVQRWWGATLPKIRGILPQDWNDRLTDRTMTSGAIALLVVLFWLTTSLLFPSRPTTAKTPPADVVARAPKIAPLNPAKLAEIQNQMAEVAEPYAPSLDPSGLDAPKLIDLVRANLNREQLTVQMGDGWYGLDSAQQDQLANDLWKRSLKLKFSQLELADAAGKPLARSPVVGSKMVVLRRELQL